MKITKEDMIGYSLYAAALVLISVPASLVLLNHKKQLACKVVRIIAWTLLFYKMTYYFIHFVVLREGVIAIPVEMSAIMYFLFPFAILTKNKVVKEFAIIGAFLAGFLQVATIIPCPAIYRAGNTPFELVETISMHFLLFIGGFIYITRIEKLNPKRVWQFILGLMPMTMWSALANNSFLKGANTMFLEKSVIPFSIFQGDFLWDYLLILIVVLVFAYTVSYFGMRKQDNSEPGIFINEDSKKS